MAKKKRPGGHINVVMNEEEFKNWKQMAAEEGLAMTVWMKQHIRRSVRENFKAWDELKMGTADSTAPAYMDPTKPMNETFTRADLCLRCRKIGLGFSGCKVCPEKFAGKNMV